MKIIAVVDVKGHCFTTTVRSMAACLDRDIQVMTSSEYGRARRQFDGVPADLLYFRSWWPKLRPYDSTPWITTISTGGKVALDRLLDIVNSGYPPPTAVVTQNNQVQQMALELGLSSAMISNGVDAGIYFPGQPTSRAIGIAATTSNEGEKGISNSIEAATALHLEFRRASHVPHETMGHWYRELWAYCHPSSREGCSNSVFEAMATGLPCLICKGVGYHGESCRDARLDLNGEVLFVDQTTDSIRCALTMLLEDQALYKRVSANARRFAEAHSWATIASRFNELFEWCVDGGRQ